MSSGVFPDAPSRFVGDATPARVYDFVVDRMHGQTRLIGVMRSVGMVVAVVLYVVSSSGCATHIAQQLSAAVEHPPTVAVPLQEPEACQRWCEAVVATCLKRCNAPENQCADTCTVQRRDCLKSC